jgi:hypothetical protein
MTSDTQLTTGKSSKVITVDARPGTAPTLRHLGGSVSDDWNNILVRQVIKCLWVKNTQPDECNGQFAAIIAALVAFKPLPRKCYI